MERMSGESEYVRFTGGLFLTGPEKERTPPERQNAIFQKMCFCALFFFLCKTIFPAG